ncbi:MAG: substrate-binding domain-containing protein, partial [Planctomycetes bacterium]|nr:substrate-binding domain-containing protein [Planctomycetota bacterium]
MLTRPLNAQQPWEYDPYQVRIWMATDDVPELTAGIRQNILRSIVWQAEVVESSAWRIAAQPCPEILRHDMLHRLDEFAAASLKDSDLVVFARPKTMPAESEDDTKTTTFTIEQLSQLTTEGLRIGICDSSNTRLGRQTKSVLEANKLWDKVKPNLASRKTTGIQLVEQVLSGELDAALVYRFHTQRVFSLSSFLSRSMLSGFMEDFYVLTVRTQDDSTTVLDGDKLILLAIDFMNGRFRIRAREMNCRTQSWSHVAVRWSGQVESITDGAMDAIIEVFSPVMRIEEVVNGDERLLFSGGSEFVADLEKGSFTAEFETLFKRNGIVMSTNVHVIKAAKDEGQWGIKDEGNDRRFIARMESAKLVVYERIKGNFAHGRLRAGGLIRNKQSPAELPDKAILRPIIRQNDRLGRLAPGGITEIPWTYLTADIRAGSKLTCAVHSSFRNAVRGKGGRRTERIGVLVSARYPKTEIRLQTRGDESRPLAGYEIYSRVPGVEKSTFLGRTDWRGRLQLNRDEAPLHILYLRSAGRLIARLPIVPGFQPVQVAAFPNDEDRLWAQALLRDLTIEFFDRVAEREVLTVVIRMRIESGKFEDAEKLIKKLEAPEFSRDHFYVMLSRVEK